MPQEDIGEKLLRGQRRQTIAMVVTYVALALAGWYVWSQESQTRTALCTLRGDLVQRVKASNDYLTAHPHGALGFTRAQIQAQIDNQQRTIDALSGLHCRD